MFDYKECLALSTILFSEKNPSGKYSFKGKEVSYEALDRTLANNLKEITGTPQLWRDNKNIVFTLIEETLTIVTPKNVISQYGMFADTTVVPQGDTKVFTQPTNIHRAKNFITRVGLAGRYEVFELAKERLVMQTTAYGGATRIPFEEFLDGRVPWAEYLNIINEGMTEAVYKEIAKALQVAIAKFPATNKVSSASFDESQFDRLIQTVAIYGSPTIYCTLEGAMSLMPSNNWISESMKDERWRNGYFTRYKSTPVVILPQSFTDETNTMKQIDPSYIYIFPTGAKKPIQVVFEGTTQVKEFQNRDWSTELQTYQKFGVAVFNTNNLAVFKNTSLKKQNVPGPWTP